MNFLDLAKKRYSTRQFSLKPVRESDLALILEAGRVAPTGANRQPQRLLVITKTEGLEKLASGANVFGAPLVIIVCADHDLTWKRTLDGKDIADIDASIVTTHMMLEATDLGLATLWIGRFNLAIIREIFKIPPQLEPINILAIGYDTGAPKLPDRHDRERQPLDELVVRDSF